MEGSIKLNPIFLRGVKRHLLDIESWAGKVITPGVINKQTVSKPWQSSTFYWLVGKLIRAQQGSIILIYLTELFLLRNEIIVAIRKKICTSPSSVHGCSSVSLWLWENNHLTYTHPNLVWNGCRSALYNSHSQATFSVRKYLWPCWREGWGVDVIVLSTFWNTHIF